MFAILADMKNFPIPFLSITLLFSLFGCEMDIGEHGSGNSDKSDGPVVRTGNFPGPDGPIRAPYIVEGDTAVVGGDILWPIHSALKIGAAAGPFNRWTDGVIPYDNAANNADFAKGVNAWNAVSGQTGVTLVKRTNQNDYVKVVDEGKCTSYLGKRGGVQTVSLTNGCPPGSGIHVIGHVIGLMHEHSRPDRDSYITINWDNIVGGKTSSFAVINLGITQGVTNYSDYDPSSIMHYRSTDYDSNILINTAIPLFTIPGAPGAIRNTEISSKDVSGVAVMYKDFGGNTVGGGSPSGCDVATCSGYSMTEGECKQLGTGIFRCESSCLQAVSACPLPPNPTPTPTPTPNPSDSHTCTNGQQIPANYYCDGWVDCNDQSDEASGCGGGNTGNNGGNMGYEDCTVGGEWGECIDTSTTTCLGQLHTGYCSGGASIRCCT